MIRQISFLFSSMLLLSSLMLVGCGGGGGEATLVTPVDSAEQDQESKDYEAEMEADQKRREQDS
ncbi:hypothetical protein N9F76_01120 [bacterium]|jgi:hypothetical protein|nr:hypothetical protein [bacterium]